MENDKNSSKINSLNISLNKIQNIPCTKEGPCDGCYYSINVPSYLPNLIGCGIAIFIGIVVFILYLIEEKRQETCSESKNKNKENEQEKNDRDAIAFGTNNVSYVVEQSTCGTPKNSGGQFKVLEKKPKAKFAHAPPITPFSVGRQGSRFSRVKTAKKEETFVCQLQITADRLGRGLELVSLINETDIPVGYNSNEEQANYALETIRSHLEKMTEEKYVVYAFLDEKNWIFSGAENTLGEFSELHLELKMVMTSPVNMQINAFSIRGSGGDNRNRVVEAPAPQPPPIQPLSHEKVNTTILPPPNRNPENIHNNQNPKEMADKLSTPGNSVKKPGGLNRQTPTMKEIEEKLTERKSGKSNEKKIHEFLQKNSNRISRLTPQKSKSPSTRTTVKTQRTEAISATPGILIKKMKESARGKREDPTPPFSRETIEKSAGTSNGNVIQL